MEQELRNKFNLLAKDWMRPILQMGYRPEQETFDAYREGIEDGYTLAKSEDAERIKELEAAINYALPLLTNTPPQHRKEFHSTARAALKKALNPKP